MRGATCTQSLVYYVGRFQSTLLMRGATRGCAPSDCLPWLISIHAPHARSDLDRLGISSADLQFQSTLLMRGATFRKKGVCSELLFQSTLLMRGATGRGRQVCRLVQISIHAPHARSDLRCKVDDLLCSISIHAPHARSDGRPAHCRACRLHFNPRSSCEERLVRQADRARRDEFQSTLLMRGATGLQGNRADGYPISIHAPHARSDEEIR